MFWLRRPRRGGIEPSDRRPRKTEVADFVSFKGSIVQGINLQKILFSVEKCDIINHKTRREDMSMQGLKKILIYVALIVMCLFLCVGYAAITDTLFINGSVNIAPPPPRAA